MMDGNMLRHGVIYIRRVPHEGCIAVLSQGVVSALSCLQQTDTAPLTLEYLLRLFIPHPRFGNTIFIIRSTVYELWSCMA